MAYKAVTDGAVTRFYDMENKKSRQICKELINEKTGYVVILDQTGKEKEFTETQVKNIIENVAASSNVNKIKTTLKSQKPTGFDPDFS